MKTIFKIWLLAYIPLCLIFLYIQYDQPHIVSEQHTILPFISGGDSSEYKVLADNLLEKHRFTYNGEFQTFRVPGYSTFLALIKFIFGSYWIVGIIQSILVLFIATLIFWICELVFSENVAKLAAILFLFEPSVMFYSQVGMSEILFLFLFMVGITYIMFADYRNELDKAGYILGGIFLGLSTLVRPVSLYIILPVAFFIFISHRKDLKRVLLSVLLILMGQSIIVVPWMTRNYIHTGVFKVSSIQSHNITFYNIVGFLSVRDRINASQAIMDVEKEIGVTMHDSLELQNSKKLDEFNSKFLGENLIEYSKFHLLKSIPVLFSSSIKTFINDGSLLYNDRVLDYKKKNIIDLVYRHEWKLLAGEIKTRGIFFMESFLWLGLVLLAGLSIFYSNKKAVIIFLISIIAYFFVVTGPVAYTRYRIPIIPFLFIPASVGLLSWIYYAKVNYYIDKVNDENSG